MWGNCSSLKSVDIEITLSQFSLLLCGCQFNKLIWSRQLSTEMSKKAVIRAAGKAAIDFIAEGNVCLVCVCR